MDVHEARAPPTSEIGIPGTARGLVIVVVLVVILAWVITWRSAADFDGLLMRQVEGSSPADSLLFLLLSAVMMVAMMLPSALPMVDVYRSLARRDDASNPSWQTLVFSTSYVAVWMLFTSLSLVVLTALGLMQTLGGPATLVPGALILAAGVYQFTAWKQFCLRHCRSPTSFVMTHWRSGPRGAGRMGFAHAFYCVGCCWLLMLVLFVAGAMSILWMGVVALLVLGEKIWIRGEGFSRMMGCIGVLIGLVVLGLRLESLRTGL